MKKIIATVLAMVMALALCTTAFAKIQTYDLYKATTGLAYNIDDDTAKPAEDLAITYHKADAKHNVIAHYTIAGINGAYVESNAKDATFIVKYTGTKTVAMYLAESESTYDFEGKVFENIGDKCGQFSLGTAYDKDDVFYTAVVDKKGTTNLYVEAEGGLVALLVDGAVVRVDKVGTGDLAAQLNEHVWKISTDKKTAKCTVCGLTGDVYTKVSAIPTDKAYDQVDVGMYVAYTASTTSNTNKGNSPKTFDAGIAMYAGMALMSVAGSAVVIGKKKEF